MLSFSSIEALYIFSFTSWTHFPTNSLGSRAQILRREREVGAMLFLKNLATLPKEHLFIVEHGYHLYIYIYIYIYVIPYIMPTP
jgi:hypothetical protein